MATGHPYLVYSLRKGANPTYDTLKALCDALGLEFYIGPKRKGLVKEMKEQLLTPEEQATISPELEQAMEQAVANQYERIWREAAENLDNALRRTKEAAEILSRPPATSKAEGLEDDSALAEPDSGKVLESPEPDPDAEICGLPYRVNICGAAGPGAFVDDENVIKLIGFRRDWLRKYGINPDKCSLIDVLGDSMEPELRDKAIILIDHQRTRRLAGRIFAVRSDDSLQIKRLEHDNHDWLLVSDNEAYPPVPWAREAVVIGQVMWTGRTL